jgi:hypothetical protein
MRHRLRLRAIVVAVATVTSGIAVPAVLQTRAAAVTSTWDLQADWRLSPNQTNTASDRWQYLRSGGSLHDPHKYVHLDQHFNSLFGVNGIEAWGTTDTGACGDNSFLPMVAKNSTASDVTPCPDVTPVSYPAGAVVAHPTPAEGSVIGWRSPIDGYVTVTGGLKDIDPYFGNGVAWTIDRYRQSFTGANSHLDGGDTTIASGTVHNGDSQAFAAGSSGGSLDAIRVTPGMMLYLTIDSKNGDWDSDSTSISMTIKPVTPPAQLRVYGTDFSTGITTSNASWSTTTTTTSPNTKSTYLGPFSTDPASATLNLNNLPTNSALLISYRIHVINTMDGDCVVPDSWSVEADGDTNVSWTTSYANYPDGCAAYPDAQSFDDDRFVPGTGAVVSNSLGEASPGAGEMDSTYQRSLLLPHGGSTAAITFAGQGLQSLEDESWGLDDVTVDVVTTANDPRAPAGVTICTYPSGRTSGQSIPLTITGKNLAGIASASWFNGSTPRSSTDIVTLTSNTKYRINGPAVGDNVNDVSLQFLNGSTAFTHCTDVLHATPYITSVTAEPGSGGYALIKGFNFQANGAGLTSASFGGAPVDLSNATYGGGSPCTTSTCVIVKVPNAPIGKRLVHVTVATAWGPSSEWVNDLFDYPHVDSLSIVKHADNTYWLRVRGRQLQYATRSYFRVRHPDNTLSARFGVVSTPNTYSDGTQSIDTAVPTLSPGDHLQSIRVGVQTPFGDTENIASSCTASVDCLEFQPGRSNPTGQGLRAASGLALKLLPFRNVSTNTVVSKAPRSSLVKATGAGFDSGSDVRLYFVTKSSVTGIPASYDLDNCPVDTCGFIRMLPSQYTDSQIIVPLPQTAPTGADYVYVRTATGQALMSGSGGSAVTFTVQANPDEIIGFVGSDGTILPPQDLQPLVGIETALTAPVAADGATTANFVNYGHDVMLAITQDGRCISVGGGNVISSGGGNVISSGGGNIAPAAYQFVAAPGAQAIGTLGAVGTNVHAFLNNADLGLIGGVISSGGGNFQLSSIKDIANWAFATSAVSTSTLSMGGLIGHAGGNVIATGGGNVIASGGGNVIASGGGNFANFLAFALIGHAGGNVIASGGGNVIASGGGNIIPPSGDYLLKAADLARSLDAMSSAQYQQFKIQVGH